MLARTGQQTFNSGTSSQPRTIVPSGTGSQRTQYKPRGFPEAVAVEDFVPDQAKGEEGGMLGTLDTALRGPAYGAERPIAAADQALTALGVQSQDESFLDPAAEALRGLPLIGGHLDNLGKLTEDAFDVTFTAVGGVMNSGHAQLIDSLKDMDDDEELGFLEHIGAGGGLFASVNGGRLTKGDYLDMLRKQGWKDQHFASIWNGERSWFDFGELAIPDPVFAGDKGDSGGIIDPETWAAVNDMGTRMVLDPLNLMFGAGVISKAHKGLKVAEAIRAGRISGKTGAYMMGMGGRDVAFSARVGKANKALTKHIYKGKPGPISAQIAALDAGITGSATVQGVGKWGSKLMKGYVKTAVVTTGAQIGVNLIDAAVPEDWEVRDGWVGDALDFFDKMGQRKPLSQNDMFTLSSLLKTPGRTIASSVVDKTVRAPARRIRRPGQVNALMDLIEPKLVKEKGYEAAWQQFVKRMGGEDIAKSAVYQVMRTSFHEKNFLQGVSSLPRFWDSSSLASVGYSQNKLNKMLTRALRHAVQEGSISARDMQRGAKLFVQGRGGLLDDVAGVQAQFDPESFYRTWSEWEPVARKVSKTFDNGNAVTPGIASDVVLTDDIDWALAELALYAKNGQVSTQHAVEVLRSVPAIFRFKESGKLQKLLTRDAKDLSHSLDEMNDVLSSIRNKHAISRTEFFADNEALELLGKGWSQTVQRQNNAMATGGRMATDISPAAGKAEVAFDYDTLKAAKATASGHEGRFISNIETMRANPAVMRAVEAIPEGLRLAGIGVVSAVDSAFMHATKGVTVATPGLIMRMNEARSVVDLMEAAAHGLLNSGGRRATVVLRGDNLVRSKGLVSNATEYSFQLGKLTKNEWDDLADYLRTFGDRVNINTTEGHVRVMVPDANPSVARKLRQAEKRMGKASEERVHFRDIIKGKKKNNVTKSQYSLDAVVADAKRAKRFFTAEEYIKSGRTGWGAKGPQSRAYRAALKRAGGSASTNPTGRPSEQPTRYEQRRGIGVRGRTSEHLVDDANLSASGAERWSSKLQESGISPDRAKLGTGDTLFAAGNRTPSGSNAGAIVRADGELITWRRNPNRAQPEDWEDVISEAAEYATWTRIIEPSSTEASKLANMLGDHGFFPAVRAKASNGEDIVYFLRDPDGVASLKFPKNKYMEAAYQSDSVIQARSPQQARAQIEGLAESMYPERTARAKQAAKDRTLLAQEERLTGLNREIEEMQSRLKSPKSSKKYREAVAARNALEKTMSKRAAQARRRQIIDEVIQPGQARFIAGAEQDVSRLKPNIDESIGGRLDELPPGERDKILALERDMRRSAGFVDEAGNIRNSTQYQLKVLPKGATPYFYGQNEAFEAVMRGHQIVRDGYRTRVTSKFGQTADFLFGPKFAKEMSRAQRQEIYNELINAGATAKEADQYLAAASALWNDSLTIGGAKLYRAPDKLAPGTLDKLARKELDAMPPMFSGFANPDVVKNIGSFSNMMQRSGSRTFQNLAKRHPAKDGKGNLGSLIEAWYGKGTASEIGRGTVQNVGAVARRGTYLGGVGYTVLRFILDPRWYLMNAFEADILGMARFGSKVRGIHGGKARNGSLRDHMSGKAGNVEENMRVEAIAGRRDPNTQLLSVEEILRADRTASGWMDPRQLYGYVAEATEATGDVLSTKWLQKMVDDGSPVIDDLRAKFGDNEQAWMDEVNEFLFDMDTKGAKATIENNIIAKEMMASDNTAYQAFVDGLWKRHQDNYKDIVHVFHGNVNRSNMERLLNSPLLWWPISYQLKVGKWLIDVATKNAAGSVNELQGAAALHKVLENHAIQMERNQDYREMFEDHPALWQSLGMMLPMTPFDMGVFMARWTRYTGSWTGAQLGLWDQDESYPQDPINFVTRSLSLGPIYSWDIIGDIIREKDN
jgi:hypothetical protein